MLTIYMVYLGNKSIYSHYELQTNDYNILFINLFIPRKYGTKLTPSA